MIRRILIPPVNEHKFVNYNDIIEGTRYNQHQFDRDWMTSQIRDWQDYREYEQKRQFLDKCSIQISATLNSTATLNIYSCNHVLIDSWDMPKVLTADGFAFTHYQDGQPYNVYSFFDALFWQNPDLEEGRYYFVIEVVNGADTDRIISEPIGLKEFHPGTVLHEYTNSFNKDLCIFEQTKQKFSLRIEGDVLDFKPLVERESFLDFGYNTTELAATTYRGWTAYVGTNPNGVPDYIFDILNYAWGLTSKRIEGKAYVAAEGAAWTKEENEGSVLKTGSLEIREQNIDSAYTIIKGSIVVVDLPAYPFVLMPISVGSDNVDDFYYASSSYITDDTTRDGLIDDLNAAVAEQGLDGEFVLNGSTIEYELGANENYDQSSTQVLTKYVQINSITTGSGQNLNLYVGMVASISGGKSAYGFINPSGNLVQSEYFSGTGLYEIFSAHIAGAAGTYSHFIFHDDTLDQLKIKGDYIRNFNNSKFPSTLRIFELTDSPRITEFLIFNTLMHAANSLQILSISNNVTLSNVRNYSDYSIGTLFGNSMKNLNQIYLRFNNQTSTNLNAFYNSMKDPMLHFPSEFTVHNGIVDTRFQLSGGQPTNFPAAGNSSQARSMLSNTYQWTVLI